VAVWEVFEMKIFLVVSLVSAVVSTQAWAAPALCGDVDGDRKVGTTDAFQVSQASKGLKSAVNSAHGKKVADVNLDGKVDDADAQMILRFKAGQVNCLPCPANPNACKSSPPPRRK
jgi:hypothetical protein